MIHDIRDSFASLGGLITVPGTIALVLWAVAPFALAVDRAQPGFTGTAAFAVLLTPYETATTMLATIATATATTLSLVYTLVLVVFTLAAGNIAPRLLKRFTRDRVNQATAGLLGGTFLFSLTVLHGTEADFVPAFSIAVAFLLAALSILQLIYFVHSVSRRVTIDEEVAEISERLEHKLSRVVRENQHSGMRRFEYPGPLPFAIGSRSTGYVARIAERDIIRFARDYDVFVELALGPGGFVLPGQTLARVSVALDEKTAAVARDVVTGAVHLAHSRGSVDDIEFEVSILLEIALRALSPGVNDTFTAIACTDRLSAALTDPVTRGLRDHIRVDDEDRPRLRVPGLTLEDLINAAFHPLRRAASQNLLMLQHLGDALMRLHEIARPADTRRLLRDHAGLLVDSFAATGPLAADLEFLKQRLAPLLRKSDR